MLSAGAASTTGTAGNAGFRPPALLTTMVLLAASAAGVWWSFWLLAARRRHCWRMALLAGDMITLADGDAEAAVALWLLAQLIASR